MKTTNELSIRFPFLLRPTLSELQKKWPWITRILRDTSPVKRCILTLATILKAGETRISPTEYEKRIPRESLGFQHMMWLMQNQNKFPEFVELMKTVYIAFPGTVVEGVDGSHVVPCVGFGSETLGNGWRYLGSDFDVNGRIAITKI